MKQVFKQVVAGDIGVDLAVRFQCLGDVIVCVLHSRFLKRWFSEFLVVRSSFLAHFIYNVIFLQDVSLCSSPLTHVRTWIGLWNIERHLSDKLFSKLINILSSVYFLLSFNVLQLLFECILLTDSFVSQIIL